MSFRIAATIKAVLAALLCVATAAPTFAQRPPQRAPQEEELPPVIVRPDEGSERGVEMPYVPQTTAQDDTQSNPEAGISWDSGAIRSDSTLVGPYNQPVWTTQRPFPTTRVYVLPPGTAELEQWVRPTWHKGEKTDYRFLEELAIGLPGRFQLDLYERWNIEPNAANDEEANHEGVQLELRYALADWGVIPLNPTLYAEWVERGGPQEKPDVYELKLLLGDEITDLLFFSSNFAVEQETSGERELELSWSNALAVPIIDRKLLAGVETVLASTTVQGGRNDQEVSFMIGPSVQVRPTSRTFLDVVGLFGTTSQSPAAQMYVVFGYQFGTRAGPENEIRAPISMRGS